jgi:hypothetical protein
MAAIKSETVAAQKSFADIGRECLKEKGYNNIEIRESRTQKGDVGFNFYDKAGKEIGRGMRIPAESIKEHRDNLKVYIGDKIDAYASLNNIKSSSRVAMKE